MQRDDKRERVSKLLSGIKAIQVKSPLKIVYWSNSPEVSSLLNKINIDLPVRILSGALPKVSQNACETPWNTAAN